MTLAKLREIIDTLGGRRFLLTFGAGVVNTVLVIFKGIDPSTYRDVILGTVGAYIVSNTYEKVKGMASE